MFALTSSRLCVLLNSIFRLVRCLLKAIGSGSLHKLLRLYFPVGYDHMG